MVAQSELPMQEHYAASENASRTCLAPGNIGLDASLAFSNYALSLTVNKFYVARLRPLGLTFLQYLVMQVLWKERTLNVSSIGQRLSLNSSTLSPTLQRMEQRHFIERVRRSDDERTVDVYLEERGSALRNQAAAMEAEIHHDLALHPDEWRDMQESLAAIRASFTRATR